MPMGRLFAVIFFLSVAFAGITSLINMFEAVSESWQNRFKLPRKAAVALCSGIALLVYNTAGVLQVQAHSIIQSRHTQFPV